MEKKLQEFYVTITETLKRSIVVEAEDEEQATEYADELCNDGIVNLDCEDFDSREVTAKEKGDCVISKTIPRYKVGER